MKVKQLKNRLIVCIFLVVIFGIIGGDAMAQPGEPEGFSGYAWGTPMEQMGALTYVGRDETGDMLYEKPLAAAHFGRARLAGIAYGFKNGRLALVTLKVDSMLQYLLLKDEAMKRYGNGEQVPGERYSYTWNAGNTRITLLGRFTES